MKDDQDRTLQQRLRAELETQLEGMDVGVTARLAAARKLALGELAKSHDWRPLGGWAVAATLVIAVGLWWQPQTDAPGLSAEDFELLVSGDSIELYEDLDFYEWLASENGAG